MESLEETINGSKRCTEWNQEPFSFELRYVKTDSQPSLFSVLDSLVLLLGHSMDGKFQKKKIIKPSGSRKEH